MNVGSENQTSSPTYKDLLTGRTINNNSKSLNTPAKRKVITNSPKAETIYSINNPSILISPKRDTLVSINKKKEAKFIQKDQYNNSGRNNVKTSHDSNQLPKAINSKSDKKKTLKNDNVFASKSQEKENILRSTKNKISQKPNSRNTNYHVLNLNETREKFSNSKKFFKTQNRFSNLNETYEDLLKKNSSNPTNLWMRTKRKKNHIKDAIRDELIKSNKKKPADTLNFNMERIAEIERQKTNSNAYAKSCFNNNSNYYRSPDLDIYYREKMIMNKINDEHLLSKVTKTLKKRINVEDDPLASDSTSESRILQNKNNSKSTLRSPSKSNKDNVSLSKPTNNKQTSIKNSSKDNITLSKPTNNKRTSIKSNMKFSNDIIQKEMKKFSEEKSKTNLVENVSVKNTYSYEPNLVIMDSNFNNAAHNCMLPNTMVKNASIDSRQLNSLSLRKRVVDRIRPRSGTFYDKSKNEILKSLDSNSTFMIKPKNESQINNFTNQQRLSTADVNNNKQNIQDTYKTKQKDENSHQFILNKGSVKNENSHHFNKDFYRVNDGNNNMVKYQSMSYKDNLLSEARKQRSATISNCNKIDQKSTQNFTTKNQRESIQDYSESINNPSFAHNNLEKLQYKNNSQEKYHVQSNLSFVNNQSLAHTNTEKLRNQKNSQEKYPEHSNQPFVNNSVTRDKPKNNTIERYTEIFENEISKMNYSEMNFNDLDTENFKTSNDGQSLLEVAKKKNKNKKRSFFGNSNFKPWDKLKNNTQNRSITKSFNHIKEDSGTRHNSSPMIPKGRRMTIQTKPTRYTVGKHIKYTNEMPNEIDQLVNSEAPYQEENQQQLQQCTSIYSDRQIKQHPHSHLSVKQNQQHPNVHHSYRNLAQLSLEKTLKSQKSHHSDEKNRHHSSLHKKTLSEQNSCHSLPYSEKNLLNLNHTLKQGSITHSHHSIEQNRRNQSQHDSAKQNRTPKNNQTSNKKSQNNQTSNKKSQNNQTPNKQSQNNQGSTKQIQNDQNSKYKVVQDQQMIRLQYSPAKTAKNIIVNSVASYKKKHLTNNLGNNSDMSTVIIKTTENKEKVQNKKLEFSGSETNLERKRSRADIFAPAFMQPENAEITEQNQIEVIQIYKKHINQKNIVIIDVFGILCSPFTINNDKYYFWRSDMIKKIESMNTELDIYLLISCEKFSPFIEDLIIRKSFTMGVAGILKEKVTGKEGMRLPADFSKAFWQINVQTFNKIAFIKSIDFDFSSCREGGGPIALFDFNNFLEFGIKDILRMTDYYHAYSMFPKKTFFVKNFMLFLNTLEYKEKPYNLNAVTIPNYDPLQPIYLLCMNKAQEFSSYRQLSLKEKRILDDRAFEARVLYYREMNTEKVVPDHIEISDDAKWDLMRKQISIFTDKITAFKNLDQRVKSVLVDIYSRNPDLSMHYRDLQVYDYKLSNKDIRNIRLKDEIYTLFCCQLENFVFIKNDIKK